MSCVCGCTMTCSIPSCVQQINIGTTTEANGTLLYVYIRNEATGYKERLEAVVSNGEVNVGTWELPESFLNPNAFFTIWVVTQAAPETLLEITLEDGTTVDTCYTLRFEDQYVDETKVGYNGIFAQLVAV